MSNASGSDAGVGKKDPQQVAQESGVDATNLPAEPGTAPDPDVRGYRHGMFGPTQGGDTTGYGGLVTPIAFPGAAVRPYGGYADEIADQLEAALARRGGASYLDAIARVTMQHGEMTLMVRREHLLAVAWALRDEPSLRFEICSSVSGVHYPQDTGAELHVAYHFLSITNDSRELRVEVTCPDADPHLPSIVEIYPAATWHERETWDFFGVVFDDHPALTRILMPDDWPGHPQRKDYPLGGIPVEFKGATNAPPETRRAYN